MGAMFLVQSLFTPLDVIQSNKRNGYKDKW